MKIVNILTLTGMSRPSCVCGPVLIKIVFFAFLVIAPGAVEADPPPETRLPDKDDSTASVTNAGGANATPESALCNPDFSAAPAASKPTDPAATSGAP